MTETLGSVNNCYVTQVLDDDHIEIIVEPTEKSEICEEVEWGRLVENSNDGKRCVEA